MTVEKDIKLRIILSVVNNFQDCHGQGKISGKWNFFQAREKSRNFVDGQWNLERTWKVREFETKWLWQAVFGKLIYSVQEGKGCTFSWDRLSPFRYALGATLKGKNLLPWGAILPLRETPQGSKFFLLWETPHIWSDTVNTIKVKNKNIFFDLSEGMENCKMSGKNQGKVREFWSGW